jgi:hypothetical protein
MKYFLILLLFSLTAVADPDSLYVNQIGDSNSLTLLQGTDSYGYATGLDGGGHSQTINIIGDYNSIFTQQNNRDFNLGHEIDLTVTGDMNTVGLVQSGSARHEIIATVNGSNNTVAASQSGSANHYLSVTENGNGNSAVVSQSGNTANTATITLTNAGAPASVNLTQTGGQSYTLNQTCYTTCGTVTVRQGN